MATASQDTLELKTQLCCRIMRTVSAMKKLQSWKKVATWAKSDSEVCQSCDRGGHSQKIEGTIPMTTKKTTEWAKRLWEEWKCHRSISSAEIPPSLEGIDNTSLNHWLPRCLMESRKQNGNYFTRGTLYSLCAGVQSRGMYEERIKMGIQEHLDIFKEPTFEYFRRAFDSTLKELHRKGVGTTVKQAEVISLDKVH